MTTSVGCWLTALAFYTAGVQLSLQITPPCSSEQHYEYSGRCCTKCEPGKYMSAKCTSTSETVCQPCGPNEYMEVWNEEEKCLLHKICDKGKALIEVNPGNSTFRGKCACISGYHWNEDCDCCRRNAKCPPGSGVKLPIQQDKNTVCQPCLAGYFSNVSSATDACKPWTNCTALGTEEKIPGNTWSDAVCKPKMPLQNETNQLLYMLIAPLLLIALAGVAVFAIYYRNKEKTLTDLQYWANEICKQIKRTKDSSHDAFGHTNMASPADLHLLGGTRSPDLDEYSLSEDTFCPHGHTLSEKTASGKDFTTLSFVTISEDGHFRQTPMEDEFMDRMMQSSCYLPLLGRLESKPFSEPLEVGENDSLSQCFTGTDSLTESANCFCSDPPCETDPVHISSQKFLQNSSPQSLACQAGDVDNRGISPPLLLPKDITGCSACKIPCRGSPSKPGSTIETGALPLCSCGLDSVDKHNLASNSNAGSGSSDGNGTKEQNAKTTTESNSSTSDSPGASGNVTGSGNSTFISSGQVMNFKGEIIVVYVSQNSQEGSMSPGSSDDSLGSPVQEENLNRCETFAGNVHQYKEKCAEINSDHSVVNKEPSSLVGEYKRTSGPIVQEETQEGRDRKLFYIEASQPVQEEGKVGSFPKQLLP